MCVNISYESETLRVRVGPLQSAPRVSAVFRKAVSMEQTPTQSRLSRGWAQRDANPLSETGCISAGKPPNFAARTQAVRSPRDEKLGDPHCTEEVRLSKTNVGPCFPDSCSANRTHFFATRQAPRSACLNEFGRTPRVLQEAEVTFELLLIIDALLA